MYVNLCLISKLKMDIATSCYLQLLSISIIIFIAPSVIPEVVRAGTSISESPLSSGSILGDDTFLK